MADPKELYRRWIDEVWTAGKVDVVDELHAPTFIDHRPVPGYPADSEGMKAFVTALLAGFPDASFTIDRLVTDGDQVVGQWTMTGTHTGEFNGIPATGKPLVLQGVDILKVADGRFTECWHLEDSMALVEQLGLFGPPPG